MSDTVLHSASINIAADTSELLPMREFLSHEIQMEGGFDQYQIQAILVAVDEAVTNLIKHGYKGDSSQNIRVVLQFTTESITITILDRAVPFYPELQVEPDLKQYMADRKRGGLGLMLIARTMDSIVYTAASHINQENALVLTKHRRA